MNYLNVILFSLYTIFSFIINFIIIFLYIRNVKIKKYLVDNYFKYMIISSIFGILDGLTLIINEINNYEIYILFKFNMVYSINMTLMLSYSYRLLVCYYNCINDNKNIKLVKIIIFTIITFSILYIFIVDILNNYYGIMNTYLFYPYFIFTILWIFSFPFLILLINKTNKNIRNEYIITFSILLIMLFLYVLSINKIIKNDLIIKYWNIFSNIIVCFSWIIPIIRLKKSEKNNKNNENIIDININYLNSIKTDSKDIKNIYLETYEYILNTK